MFGDLVFARPVIPNTTGDNPAFPLYLFPTISLPWRNTTRSPPPSPTSIPSLSSSPTSPTSTPRLTRTQPTTLRCGTCAADLAYADQIVSKGFTGRHGRAYLVAPPSTQATPSCPSSPVNDNISGDNNESDLINIRVGRNENRQLVTGQHVVADIWCVICSTKLGWKYVDAKEQAQKYKVGKFILETQRVVASHGWEDVEVREEKPLPRSPKGGRVSTDTNTNSNGSSRVSEESELGGDDGVVVFDSEDEDECEDIFAGVWDPEVVAKRRRSRVSSMRT
ncbi:hypothetical protein OQA88_13399 [Cercophora sp. LCS_1]